MTTTMSSAVPHPTVTRPAQQVLTLHGLLRLVLLKHEELERVIVTARRVVQEGSGLGVRERVVADLLEVWSGVSV